MSHENSTFLYKYILGYVGRAHLYFFLPSLSPHLKQEVQTIKCKISYMRDSGGPVVGNCPCNAGDITGSILVGELSLYAAGQQSLCVTPTELSTWTPCAYNYRAWQTRGHDTAGWAHMLTVDKARHHLERLRRAKINKYVKQAYKDILYNYVSVNIATSQNKKP